MGFEIWSRRGDQISSFVSSGLGLNVLVNQHAKSSPQRWCGTDTLSMVTMWFQMRVWGPSTGAQSRFFLGSIQAR